MEPEIRAGTARERSGIVVAILAMSLIAWAALLWLSIDMRHPLAQLAMPMSARWDVANLLAIGVMWAVMMAAMMLPSALPTILTFGHLSARQGEHSRWWAFVGAYLLAWTVFSAIAVGAQWLLQFIGLIDPMLVSTSLALNASLLLIAGVYQFSPLKRVCLANCRTPLGFLLGEWRPGVAGAFRMGWRHGTFCLGCCWALMVLLFVGGAMNLIWIAALSVIVAIEKLTPRGHQIAWFLGAVLLGSGAWRIIEMLQAVVG